MSSTDGEAGIRKMTDKATYERLEKDVAAVKNDIAALTEQLTDALNSFAGTAQKQARRGYKQARANADATVDEDVHAVGGEVVEDAAVVGDQEDPERGPRLPHRARSPLLDCRSIPARSDRDCRESP